MHEARNAHPRAGRYRLHIDTSADVFGGDEISRSQVRQFVGLLIGIALRNNCAVILLAHPSMSGMASGTGTSGSTGWHNSVRSRMYLEGDDKDDDARTLKFKKSNYGGLRRRQTQQGHRQGRAQGRNERPF